MFCKLLYSPLITLYSHEFTPFLLQGLTLLLRRHLCQWQKNVKRDPNVGQWWLPFSSLLLMLRVLTSKERWDGNVHRTWKETTRNLPKRVDLLFSSVLKANEKQCHHRNARKLEPKRHVFHETLDHQRYQSWIIANSFIWMWCIQVIQDRLE